VTTTMDIDKGLQVLLPPYSEEPPEDTQLNKRNVLDILINASDMLLVKGEPLDIAELKELTKKHVDNHGVLPEYSISPNDAIVSLKNDRGTTYDLYVAVQNELKAAYNELRDGYAMKRFGVKYDVLDDLRKKEVRQNYPLKISEAEPEDIGKTN